MTFPFAFGQVVSTIYSVDSPHAEPGTPHVGDHEFREVIYAAMSEPGPGGVDRDYAACGCGQMAKRAPNADNTA